MQYREQLLQFLENETNDELMEWIQSHSLLVQVDIFREMKILAEEKVREDNPDDKEEKYELFDEFGKHINAYEESILEEKLNKIKLDMVSDQMEKILDKLFDEVIRMRNYAIECIRTNAPNADAMRVFAKQLMQLEKEANLYDPEVWRGIEL